MRITSLIGALLSLLIATNAHAGQIPSHIYTGDNIRSANPNIEKYIAAAPEAYLAGSNGPDISNIMHYLTTPSIGAESHYEKTGELCIALLDEADTDEEKAFALGWITHWINDYFVHALVNQWGGWFENDDTRHKSLEMLENKYVYSAKFIRKYKPDTIPAAMEQDTYEAVYQAFKKTYPNKSEYTSSSARTNFLLWFRQANGHIRNASQSFMEAADNADGKATNWITWAAFPNMPSEDQYKNIMKFAKITDVSAEKGKLTAKIDVYDTKLHKWFLKQWDEAQVSATQYSKQVCDLVAQYLAADGAKRAALRPQLSVVLPNVSIDQPRNDYDNSKIYPGNVNAKEVYYECTITDTTSGSGKVSVVKGTQPIKIAASTGFDGASYGDITLDIPITCDTYKYDLKVSFKDKDVLSDAELKDYTWLGAEGSYGTTVTIEGDKSCKAGSVLKLKAVVQADPKTKPLIKLRWKNETTTSALGTGETLSFTSTQLGKQTVKVEAYGTVNQKEVIFADAQLEIEVTEPDIELLIKGETSVEPGKPLPLEADVRAESSILKAIEVRWTDDSGKTSYGKGMKLNFSSPKQDSFVIKAEAFWKPDAKSSPISVGSDTITVTVGKGIVSLKVEGANAGAPSQAIPLKAMVEGVPAADLPSVEYIWSDSSNKVIARGASTSFKADQTGTYTLSVEAVMMSGGKKSSLAKASHTIQIGAGAATGSGLTATIAGLPADAIEGGTVVFGADEFRSGDKPYVLVDNADAAGVLAAKWSEYWQSTHKSECDEAVKQGKSVESIVPARPNGWGVESVKVVWKSDPALSITPADTTNNAKTSAKLSAPGKYTIWAELYLKTANGLQAKKAGETDKRVLTVSPPTLTVELKPSKLNLKPGEIADVRVVITGGKAPYEYIWTGDHAGDGAAVSTVSRKIGPLPLSVSVKDADGKTGSASVTLRVAGVKAKLAGVESKVIYGTKGKLGNQIEGDDQPEKDTGICDHCGKKRGSNKNCLWCVLSAHEVTKENSADGTPYADRPIDPNAIQSVSTAPGSNDAPPPPVISSSNSKPTQTTKKPDDKQPKRMIIWQSEPALTFSPPKSADGKTTVLYDRVGKVKIWTEILEMKDGVYQTVGETDQVEIDVAPPAFAISFSPESAKTGQEVKATVKTTPVISDKLLNYVWFSPESSNRMEYEKNASVIGFKLKDAKPVELNVEARVPFFGDTLAEGITATFTGSQYLMTTKVTGTKPRIWKEGVGLVEVERAYAVDQNVTIRAEFVDDKPSGDVRYQWTVNEGTTMGSSGLGNEITVSRHEVGTIEAKVETRDPDGAPLGRATAVVSITVSADDLKKAKDKGGAISVVLTAPKSSIVLGENLKLSAAVKGGVAPYKFTWSAGCKPAGATAVYASKTDGKQNITVTAKDSKGKTATATLSVTVVPSGLNVQLTAGKSSLMVNESTSVKAVISGGKAPYTLTWSPNIEGAGNEVRMTGADPGPATVTLKVVDAQKKTVTKQVAFQVSPLVPTLQGIPEQSVLGSQVVASITYPQSPVGSKINSKPLPTIYWRCEPHLNMSTKQSDGPGNLITFDTLGSVKIWGEIISPRGKLIGKTEVKSCNVLPPAISMKYEPMAQGVVQASVKVEPESALYYLDLKWMRPAGGMVLATNGTIYSFKPGSNESVDVYLVIRHKTSSAMVKEIKESYKYTSAKDKPSPGNAATPKDKPSVTTQPKPESATGAVSEADATAQIGQARTLAANGKIEEAIEIVRGVEKVVPEKSSEAMKAIAKDAANWGMTVISNDLDFTRASQLLALAVKLDPANTDAATKQKTVTKWANNWDAAQVFVDQFNKSLTDGRIVTAEAQNKEARSRIEGIPGTKPTALINDMSSRYAKARDQYILKLQPKRLLVMDYMKGKSYGQARTVIDEVLTYRVVPELTASHKQEFEGWLDTCNKQTKTAQTGTTSKPADSSKPQSTKKKGSSLDDIIGALDKIGAAIDTATGKKPAPSPAPAPAPAPTSSGGAATTSTGSTASKPTVVVAISNTAACQFTDTARFKLDKPVNVTQLIIWYSWNPGESSVAYKLYGGGEELRSSRFVKGDTDTYQKQWGNGVDEPQMNLQAGEYVVKVANKRLAQNSGTGGNGMIRVITGGYLVTPSSGIAQQPVSTQTKPTTADKPQASAPPVAASDTASAQKPVAPQSMSALPSGWVTRSAGDVTVSMPGNWAAVKDLSGDEGAWYQGNIDVPDIGFGIVRGGKTEDALDNLQLQSQADITVGGLPARSYIGKAKGSDLTGWLIAMKTPRPDGRMLFFVGVSKPATWSTYKPTLEKVVGTIKIGSAAGGNTTQAAKPAAPAPKPAATGSSPKMVVATLSNKASQNVHIFVDGDTFGEHNRLTPGQTRTLSIKMPANGRIKFTAGRNGNVITTKTWDGDPDDTSRVPKVIFDSSEKLIITTGLR